MLNKEAQDLPTAKVNFSVSTRRLDLDSAIRNSDFYVCKYFNNNTIYDLTIMDNFGIRQTLKRKKERVGKQILQIVHEYRISHLLENEISNFFDEVGDIDGEVLKAIKEAVSAPEFFKSKGFGNEYFKNASTGFMFCVTFDIEQSQLARDLTVNCHELGITISRKNRQSMPSNPCYSIGNKGSYNPFRKIVGNTFSMKRVFANSIKQLNNRYWYFIGDSLHEVEYSSNCKMTEGIVVVDYVKRFDLDEVISNEIKNITFDEASNKNGFFISERDAMLASNLELSAREKEVSLKEREHAIRLEDIDAQRSLNISKRELSVVKHEADMEIISNTKEVEKYKHGNTIQAFLLEQQTMAGKSKFIGLTLLKDLTTFNNEVALADMQYRNEVLKMQAVEKKHLYTINEIDRSEKMSVITGAVKMHLIEADIIQNNIEFRRKVVEENIKGVNHVINGVTSIIKLIGK